LFDALLFVKIVVNFSSIYIVEMKNRLASDHIFGFCWTN